MSGIFKEGDISFTLFFTKMHSFNAAVLLLIVSSPICVIYTQDGYNQLPDQNSVCLCENDPYVLNVPKLLNISLNGKMEVVHSNVDKFTGISESCNGIAPADLETFQLKIEKKFKDISEENEDVKEILKENRGNISSEIASIKKEISEDKQNMKKKIEDLHDVLREIKDAIKEIPNNVSSETTGIKKETSGINVLGDVHQRIIEKYKETIVKEFEDGVKDFRRRVSSELANITSTSIHYIPESCKEIYKIGKRVTGVYKIQPKSMTKPFDVFCDLETRGGGWMVIQNRFDGSQDFDLSWNEYKDGFGDINKEFWIGLEKIYQMTSYEKNELLVELVTKTGTQRYAQYREFGIGPESTRYNLTTLEGYSGDAGDFVMINKGHNFCTTNDRYLYHHRGGWWFQHSSNSNLNGPYSKDDYGECVMEFFYYTIGCTPLSKSRMLIRPV